MNKVKELKECLGISIGKKFKLYNCSNDKEIALCMFDDSIGELKLVQYVSNSLGGKYSNWIEVNSETIETIFNTRFSNEWYFREDGDYQYTDDTIRRRKSPYRDNNGNMTHETANFEKEIDAKVTSLIAKGREKGFTFEEIFYSIVQCIDMQILRMRREERNGK